MEAILVWGMIAGLAAGTLAMRVSFLALLARAELPPLARRGLRYVPPAVIAAIVTPQLFPGGAPLSNPDAARITAAAAATLVAWKTRSTLLTVVLGMAVLWGMQALLD